MAESLRQEQMLQGVLDRAQQDVQCGGMDKYSSKTIEQMVSKAEAILSPTHFLVVQILQFAATVFVSQAVNAESFMQKKRGQQLRLQSASAALRATRLRECIASGCQAGSFDCACTHAAVYECAREVFHAGQDLLAMEPGSAPGDLIGAVARYLPSMRILYGKGDEDVDEIERMIQRAQMRCGVPATFDQKVSGVLPAPVSASCKSESSGLPKNENKIEVDVLAGCNTCGKTGGKQMVCGRCKRTQYCSKECQAKDWKVHKPSCIP